MVRLACIGGFLGAGKTTALIEAARTLIARGSRVGVITNDQGSQLVDTALVRRLGIHADEITGGCFCCRFTDFVQHASRLVERHRPDIILAEAVGSCTDLAATVYEPLRRFHAAAFDLAPLSVFVEPSRIRELLGPASPFGDSVHYLFERQLAEAECIILSKADLLTPAEATDFAARIARLVGPIPVGLMSGRTGQGLNEWVDQLATAPSRRARVVDVDYELYGQAEAALGWLNATVDLVADQEFRPAVWGEALINEVQVACLATAAAIAHVKILLVTPDGSDRIGLTANAGRAIWDAGGNLAPAREVSAIINARVATSPEELQRVVEHALQSAARASGVRAAVLHMESFAPAPPTRPVLEPTT